MISEEVLNHSNLDLVNIHTPVDASKLEELLTECKYDADKTKKLVEGFRC